MGEKKIDKMIGKKDVALKLGISFRSVEKYMKDRGLPYYKIGSLVRFNIDEVDKWLRERKVVND